MTSFAGKICFVYNFPMKMIRYIYLSETRQTELTTIFRKKSQEKNVIKAKRKIVENQPSSKKKNKFDEYGF